MKLTLMRYFALFVSALLLAPSGAAAQPPGPFGTDDPFTALNLLFREAYRVERERIEAELSPVVIVSGDDLTLVHRGRKVTVRVIPPAFHELKSIAHLPFTLYLRLRSLAGLPSGLADLKFLPELEAAAAKVEAAAEGVAFTPRQRIRQAEIFAASRALMTHLRHTGTISSEELQSFARAIGPRILANAHEAAELQVFATHAQMMRWKRKMSCAEWQRLKVVNRGGHQARYNNAATQYFGWLLGVRGAAWAYPGESLQVVYAEVLPPSDEALDLLAKVVLDAEASRAFFDDPLLLSEDILSHGAAHAIASFSTADRACGNAGS